MKKSLKKVIGTVAAFTALTAVMAVSASAAEVEAGQGISFKATAAAEGEQVTILVLKDKANATDGITEDEIAYIDQQSAVQLSDGTYGYEFNMPVATTAGEEYAVLTGAESKTEATTGTVTITGGNDAIHYGDVTGEGVIDGSDSLEVLYYYVKMDGLIGTFTGVETPVIDENAFLCADVTKEGTVDASDSLEMLYYFVKMDNSIDTSWMTVAAQ